MFIRDIFENIFSFQMLMMLNYSPILTARRHVKLILDEEVQIYMVKETLQYQ